LSRNDLRRRVSPMSGIFCGQNIQSKDLTMYGGGRTDVGLSREGKRTADPSSGRSPGRDDRKGEAGRCPAVAALAPHYPSTLFPGQECRRLKPARSEVRGLAARVNSCPDTRLCRRLKPAREGQGGLVGTTERQLKESPKQVPVPPAEAGSGGETKGLDAGLRASSTRPPLGLIASCWRPAKRAAWSAALFELSSSRPTEPVRSPPASPWAL
jgi:hypothetical protein